MADVAIDITGEDGDIGIENPMGFDLRITGCGLSIDLTHEQAQTLYAALRPLFDDVQQGTEGEG